MCIRDRQKAGQFASAQFVSISSNDDVPIFAEVEMCIAKSPDVEALGVGVCSRAWWFRDNEGSIGSRAAKMCFFEYVAQTQSGFYRETGLTPVSYTHLRAHETPEHLVCRLLL